LQSAGTTFGRAFGNVTEEKTALACSMSAQFFDQQNTGIQVVDIDAWHLGFDCASGVEDDYVYAASNSSQGLVSQTTPMNRVIQ
jgi:hypothetical protein